MSEKNLLITIVDTNPVWWNLQSSGALDSLSGTKESSSHKSDKFNINDFFSCVIGFLNAYKTMNQQNAVALIAAHNTKADYLYPSRTRLVENLVSPWDKYEQISDMDEQIKENIKKLSSEQLEKLNSEINNKDNSTNDSMITSAVGLALCYINRIQRKFTITDTVNYRILIIKGSDDSSNQYMNFMNMIFSSEKLNVLIDSCSLIQDSSLLQQASSLTNGFYFKVAKLNGLLNYLLWLFLPDENTRKMLVYPPKIQVDFRAACFCHRKLIDVGYVCSVCLSVFCSFTPICSTCNCNFQFDVNMLKKASLLKQVSGKLNQQQQAFAKISRNLSASTATQLNKKDEYATNRLATKFQDTSLSSPINPITISDNSNDTQQMMDLDNANSNSNSVKTVIVSAATVNKPLSNQNKSLNDSLDMLE